MEIRNRVVELRRVKAKELVPNPKNWRRHPKVQANALRGLLGEIGIADALLVRELPDGRLQLIDGHLRADVMPNEEVPVLILDLNEAEADKVLLTLDPLAAMASLDGERLGALLDSVRTDDPAVQVLLDELRAQEGLLLENLNDVADPDPQINKAEELRRKWGTEEGQLWHAGPHRLICGDCTQPEVVARLLGDATPHVLITDPPYGIELDSEWRDRAGLNGCGPAEASYMKHRTEGHTETTISGDTRADWSEAFALVPDLQVGYVWHASKFTSEVLAGLLRIGFLHHQQIIWNLSLIHI